MTAENRKLAKPLSDALIELTDLRKKLENFNKERSALARTKMQYATVTRQLNEMKWETEALRMRCETVTEDRDQLKKNFEKAVLELQQKTGLKNVLLERKLTMCQKDAEKREVLLHEVLKAAGIEPHQLNVKVEEMLQMKNKRIDDLQYELARVCKAHDDLVRICEMKFQQFDIPKEELNVQPLWNSVSKKFFSEPTTRAVSTCD